MQAPISFCIAGAQRHPAHHSLYVKNPPVHFNIVQYIQFITSSTKSSQCKIKCLIPSSKSNRFNFFFINKTVRLWNVLPVFDFEIPISKPKPAFCSHLWQHFLVNYSLTQPCSWYYVCPCHNCSIGFIPYNYIPLHVS